MYDYIIVGQGIAGTVLAHTLLHEGFKIYVVDQNATGSSSMVAAGIYNPVTGKRMVKTWRADQLFPFLESFYTSLENLLETSLLNKMPIYKPFGSIAEQNFKISDSILDDNFCDVSIAPSFYSAFIHNPYGGFQTKHSGWVDVKSMLLQSRIFFEKQHIYRSSAINYHDIVLENDTVQWKEIKARRLIFCEGIQAAANPFFNWLPFVPAKGEMLHVIIKDFPENVILNKSVFLVPLGQSSFKVGATYEWNFSDGEISNKGKDELISRLENLIKADYSIHGQEGGIRPTVKDRRPLLGLHPQYKTLGIFNGLGTKGISIAPYFAHHFVEFLEKGKNLDLEVNIERFASL